MTFSEQFKEVMARTAALDTPEAKLLHGYYSTLESQEEIQKSTEEMMGILLSIQYVSFSGRIYGRSD